MYRDAIGSDPENADGYVGLGELTAHDHRGMQHENQNDQRRCRKQQHICSDSGHLRGHKDDKVAWDSRNYNFSLLIVDRN